MRDNETDEINKQRNVSELTVHATVGKVSRYKTAT